MAKKSERKLTPRQIKLLKLIRENLGNMESTKTMGELLLEAGYTKATAKNAYLIIDTEVMRKEISSFVDRLDDKRKMAITHLTEKKLNKANAREVAYVIDVLTKNYQLLTGGKTENVGLSLSDIFEQTKND